MKLKFSVACLIIFCFAINSCDKDSDNPVPDNSYIKAKFNGQEMLFNSNLHVVESSITNPSLNSIVIAGDSEVETFDMQIYSPNDFSNGGTYGNLIPGGELSEARYKPDYSSTDSSSFYYSNYKYVAVPEKIECKITKITADYIMGTFTTDLYKDKFNANPEKIAVTQGEFFIKK